MGNLGVLARGLVLLAAAGLAQPAPAPLPLDPCGVPALLADARAMVQDDGGSGRDAGDCAEMAVAVAQDGFQWAYLDSTATGGMLDRDDWFSMDIAGLLGMGSWATIALTPDVLTYPLGAAGVPPLYLPHVPLHMEVLAPDGGIVASATSCSLGVHFAVHAEGGWLLRVYRPEGAPEVPCIAPTPEVYPDAQAPPGQTYGFYLGCRPHCVGTGD